MNLKKLPKYLSTLALATAFLLGNNADLHAKKHEDYQNRKKSRWEAGVIAGMSIADFHGVAGIFDASQNYLRDTTIASQSVMSSPGFGSYLAWSAPIMRMGRRSTLSLSVGAGYYTNTWKIVPMTYFEDGTSFDQTKFFANPIGGGITTKYIFPIGIDFKKNTDAKCYRNTPVGWTVGVGATMQYTTTVYGSTFSASGINSISDWGLTGTYFSFMPYLKTELSFFAGVCFKVNARLSYGSAVLFQSTSHYASNGADAIGSYTLSETANASIGISVLPISYKWSNVDPWFDEYETQTIYK